MRSPLGQGLALSALTSVGPRAGGLCLSYVRGGHSEGGNANKATIPSLDGGRMRV